MRRWLERFETGGLLDLTYRSDDALDALVRGSPAAGQEALSRIDSELRSAERRLASRPSKPPAEGESQLQVVHRWYRYARAFDAYLRGDFPVAHEELDGVREAVAAAISRYGFLEPLAMVAVDMELLRARIARDARRWDEMAQRIRTARRKMSAEEPLLTLPNGDDLSFRRLESEFPRGRRSGLAELFDAESRIRIFDRYAASLYALPGFLIES